jgi:hypothetical protein
MELHLHSTIHPLGVVFKQLIKNRGNVYQSHDYNLGHVQVLCYKPECRGIETRLGELFFLNLPNPSGRTRPWGLLSL